MTVFDRILILGNSGYIGSRLETAFRRDASIEVVGRSKPEVDLTREDDVAALAPLCGRGTVIVLCAAIKKQLGDNEGTFIQNLRMVMNVGRLIAGSPVARVVFFSSTAVYGEDVENIGTTEARAVTPTSYYGIGKYTAERLLSKAAAAGAVESLLVLRPALVYGPDEPAIFYGPSGFLRTASSGRPIALWGDGEELREFIYIDDLVDAAHRLTLQPSRGVVNVVSGTSYRFVDALQIIETIVGRPIEINAKPRTKHKVNHTFDNTALRAQLPDVRFTPLADGLAKVAAQYQTS